MKAPCDSEGGTADGRMMTRVRVAENTVHDALKLPGDSMDP